MFERLKLLFASGNIDERGIDNAVKFGWITTEQAAEIKGG